MANIKPVGVRGTKTLNVLTEGLNFGEGRKINNSSVFVPVSVFYSHNVVYHGKEYPVFSVCHYVEQNGDLLCDPEVLFWKIGDNYYPLSCRMDLIGKDSEYVRFEDGEYAFNAYWQNDLVTFCNQWMQNIKKQQRIK